MGHLDMEYSMFSFILTAPRLGGLPANLWYRRIVGGEGDNRATETYTSKRTDGRLFYIGA